MDPHDSASLDAPEVIESGDSASSLTTGLGPPLELTPVTKDPAVHHVGRFAFSEDQLDYVLVNLVHVEGINTTSEVVLVMKYKWPEQFELLLNSDLEMVIQWFCPNPQASQPSIELGGTNDYVYGKTPLDPEGGWDLYFVKQRYASRLVESTQIVNNFKYELAEAEFHRIRQLAKRIEPKVVQIILATKLHSDLSSVDIALGLTNLYSILARGLRYVWMFPFTELHVEIIWRRSLLSQTKTFKMVSGMDRQKPGFIRSLEFFREQVELGRADETLKFDPRSRGNEMSLSNLVEEVIHIVLTRDGSETRLGGLMLHG